MTHMTPSPPAQLPPPSDRSARRRVRTEAIHDAAVVRAELGQGARHAMADGEHTIVWQGVRYVGATIEEVIRRAQAQEAEK
ncbi:MAG TPA: hypothetical protein VMY37_11005 [Thermoguttaceae bacterium]|nr:hypothetical protein [Thermoguttaceae bacterium]